MSESNNNDADALILLNLNPADPPKFFEMNSKDFENLTCALLGKEQDLGGSQLFGTNGQAQYGIDSWAPIKSGGIAVASSKCYQKVTVPQLAKWSNDFLEHLDTYWASRDVRRFILAVGSSVDERSLVEAVLDEKDRFAAKGIEYQVWAPHHLQNLLRSHPGIVAQYLGHEWIQRICGHVPRWPLSNANDVSWLSTVPSAHSLLADLHTSVTKLTQALDNAHLLDRLPQTIHDTRLTTQHEAPHSAWVTAADGSVRDLSLQTQLHPQAEPRDNGTGVPGKLEHWFFIARLDTWYIRNGYLSESRWKHSFSAEVLAYAMLVDPIAGKAHIEFFLAEDKLDLRGFLHRAWASHKAYGSMLTGVPDELVLCTRRSDWFLVWDDEENLGGANDVTEFLANRWLVQRSLGDIGSPVTKSLLATLRKVFVREQANLDDTDDAEEPVAGGEWDEEMDTHDDDPIEHFRMAILDEPGGWNDARLAELGAAASRAFSAAYRSGRAVISGTAEILPEHDKVARPLTDAWLLLSGHGRHPPTNDWSDTEFRPFFSRVP